MIETSFDKMKREQRMKQKKVWFCKLFEVWMGNIFPFSNQKSLTYDQIISQICLQHITFFYLRHWSQPSLIVFLGLGPFELFNLCFFELFLFEHNELIKFKFFVILLHMNLLFYLHIFIFYFPILNVDI